MQFAMEERTFTIIKPNAVAMGVTGRIIDAFLQDGFRILAMRLVCMSRNDAEKFYAVHRGREFFSRLVDFMTSGPCVVMLLEREDAAKEELTAEGVTFVDVDNAAFTEHFSGYAEANFPDLADWCNQIRALAPNA